MAQRRKSSAIDLTSFTPYSVPLHRGGRCVSAAWRRRASSAIYTCFTPALHPRGRCVVLTTHSMEEADILADRLAIIAKGRLRCVGTRSAPRPVPAPQHAAELRGGSLLHDLLQSIPRPVQHPPSVASVKGENR